MTTPTHITDGSGSKRKAEVTSKDGVNGLLVYTRQELEFNPRPLFFVNPSFGAALNQNVGFTGNATVIHAGVNSGAAITGTTTGTTTNHLIDSGETFSNVEVGFVVTNTTSGNEYARVTAVASNDLTLDADILVSGEDYEINPIWVGNTVQGTWNFADSAKITITDGLNNDEASFENDSGQQWDLANNTTLTGKIDLDSYDVTRNSITIAFDLNGTQVGDTVILDDYINTDDFAEQSFAIPKSAFAFPTTIVNGMTISIVRTGGAKVTAKFDDLQWEKSGDVVVFQTTKDRDMDYYIHGIRFSFVDDIAATVTNGTVPGLAYNKIMDLSALTNGIVFRRVQNGQVNFSATLKQLSDFMRIGSTTSNAISDGTNTMLTVDVEFFEPIILRGTPNINYLSLTVADNLSGLLLFNVIARGVDRTN